ncbi:hypothetical protein [Desertivibrio insolitus]|uniref:hypothetical protein n=1 Tax=Herbiconiux sp. SYSU D00978 TaxID=2812562 RepID=UPI001A95BB5E|nr:hypothetical protein [Herbiconiux sp. SYSU D00978]
MKRLLIALPLAGMLALAGCATEQPPEYDLSTAQGLQTQVYAVSDLAAQAKHPEALAKLDELSAAAGAALSAGRIDQARYDRIMLAIEQVRGRLGTIIASGEKAALEQQLQEQQRRLEEQQAEIDEQQRQQQQQQSPGGSGDDSGGDDVAPIDEDVEAEVEEKLEKAKDEAEKKAEEAEKKAEEAKQKAEEQAEKQQGKNDD